MLGTRGIRKLPVRVVQVSMKVDQDVGVLGGKPGRLDLDVHALLLRQLVTDRVALAVIDRPVGTSVRETDRDPAPGVPLRIHDQVKIHDVGSALRFVGVETQGSRIFGVVGTGHFFTTA